MFGVYSVHKTSERFLISAPNWKAKQLNENSSDRCSLNAKNVNVTSCQWTGWNFFHIQYNLFNKLGVLDMYKVLLALRTEGLQMSTFSANNWESFKRSWRRRSFTFLMWRILVKHQVMATWPSSNWKKVHQMHIFKTIQLPFQVTCKFAQYLTSCHHHTENFTSAQTFNWLSERGAACRNMTKC